jgi:hypothetical protein
MIQRMRRAAVGKVLRAGRKEIRRIRCQAKGTAQIKRIAASTPKYVA